MYVASVTAVENTNNFTSTNWYRGKSFHGNEYADYVCMHGSCDAMKNARYEIHYAKIRLMMAGFWSFIISKDLARDDRGQLYIGFSTCATEAQAELPRMILQMIYFPLLGW